MSDYYDKLAQIRENARLKEREYSSSFACAGSDIDDG